MEIIQKLGAQSRKLGRHWLSQSNQHLSFNDRFIFFKRRLLLKGPESIRFSFFMIDEALRSYDPRHLSHFHSILSSFLASKPPLFLTFIIRLTMKFGFIFPRLMIPILRKVTAFIFSDYLTIYTPNRLKTIIESHHSQGIGTVVNVIGEDVMSHQDANDTLAFYFDLIDTPSISHLSIKLSQLTHLRKSIDSDQIAHQYMHQLRAVFDRVILVRTHNLRSSLHITLDMEYDRDHLIVFHAFLTVLSESSYRQLSAGIAIQAYSRDSFSLVKTLSTWARDRVKEGGAPISIRLVKGANMKAENQSAAHFHRPSSLYSSKVETDANFKRLITHCLDPYHAPYMHVGVASHNVFDCAFAYLMAKHHDTLSYLHFEFLQGMHPGFASTLTHYATVLKYSPIVPESQLNAASAYLTRRLAENSSSNHFLHYLLFRSDKLSQNISPIELQFNKSLSIIQSLPYVRDYYPTCTHSSGTFTSTPSTAWHYPYFQQKLKSKTLDYWAFPPVIIGSIIDGNHLIPSRHRYDHFSPNFSHSFYQSSEFDQTALTRLEHCIHTPLSDLPNDWTDRIIQIIESERFSLLSILSMDVGKSYEEADHEINEGIDFIKYYRKLSLQLKQTPNITLAPLGTLLVAAPWNFPFSIALGLICAGLLTGNRIIFKPSPHALWVGWTVARLLWKSGVSYQHLHFIATSSASPGSHLIASSIIDAIALTGSAATAATFSRLNPSARLIAETSGKNTLTISSLCDHDHAISIIIESCFSFSGQKCSAVSLILIEDTLYEDASFISKLSDAVSSLPVGPSHDPAAIITPLISKPNDTLLFCLESLEDGQEWVLKPTCIAENQWTPGLIKGVAPHHTLFRSECFAPIVGLIPYRSIRDACQLIDSIPYGLTAGLVSLSPKEQQEWVTHIRVGNYYINRPTVGAKVAIQPFGGVKHSQFGYGFKSGGPLYLHQFLKIVHKETEPRTPVHMFPKRLQPVLIHAQTILLPSRYVHLISLVDQFMHLLIRKKWRNEYDAIDGECNTYFMKPVESIAIRIESGVLPFAIYSSLCAALCCGDHLVVSAAPHLMNMYHSLNIDHVVFETVNEFRDRITEHPIERIRIISPTFEQSNWIQNQVQGSMIIGQCATELGPYELLNYLEETSISIALHRYGMTFRHPDWLFSHSA